LKALIALTQFGASCFLTVAIFFSPHWITFRTKHPFSSPSIAIGHFQSSSTLFKTSAENISPGDMTVSSMGTRFPVSFLDLGLHSWVGQVEITQFLQSTDADAKPPLVDLPDEFGTVDAIVGPLKSQVIGLAAEPPCRLPENFRSRQLRKEATRAREEISSSLPLRHFNPAHPAP
jgi:hypothetical protein